MLNYASDSLQDMLASLEFIWGTYLKFIMSAGLRGMAATRDLTKEETLVSLPVSAALVVAPKERCRLPSSFCSAGFYLKKPW